MANRVVVLAACVAMISAAAGCERGQASPVSAATMARKPVSRFKDAADSMQMVAIKHSIDSVTSDLDSMSAANGDAQRHMLPAHETLVSEFLSRNDAKMRAMHVKIDPDWLTVIDSVRNDLARMPNMSSTQLHAFFPEHARRVMRIVACIDMRGM
ncbi:MAG TPA: hypothetical protein VIC24_03950 [Gemmatimonadaceae bacterium]